MNAVDLEALANRKLKRLPKGFEIIEKRYSYGFWGSLAWRLSIRNPLKMINKSKLCLAFLPFYLLAVLPFTVLFNHLDMKTDNRGGTGIIIVAEK